MRSQGPVTRHRSVTAAPSCGHAAVGAYPSMQRDDAFLRAWRDTATRALDPEDDDRARPPLQFRTLWISDLHLGTPGCQARALLDFLKHTECETLFLVGDIIDGWQPSMMSPTRNSVSHSVRFRKSSRAWA